MGEQTQVQDSKPILVIGGTGKTGRRIADRLTERGVPVRVASRSTTPTFDWTDESGWAAALAGTRAAYIAYQPDLAFPGAPEAITRVSELAKAAGVEKLVLLSGRGEEAAEVCERIVQAAGLKWTIVRCSWFNQNFSENFLLESVRAGEIALPAGDAVEPFVDADDIADVAVAALTEDGHDSEIYELTGPRLLSFHDVATEISKATGQDVAYIPLTPEQYAAALREHGMPEEFVELFTQILDGRNANLTNGVRRALGREPKDFADYARDAAASGVWSVD
ncbi:NAD(P)H-binding protein [Actinokineospora sp.]|uniref:NmrA family NAD(P)-binding protein n=1 Tax=Actinokineospora sp. TaxID=1872133 RepID=UPI003D6A4696